MAKLAADEVSMIEIAMVANTPGIRTAISPFSSKAGRSTRYVGAAVAWKKRPEAMPDAVKAGLNKAIGISKGCAGIKGVATNPLTGGLVPAKVICQLKKAGKVK